MSYRSFKRVLGETHLERKCRVLFGVALLLMVLSSFWWVEHNAENLVKEKTRQTGRDYVDSVLLVLHWKIWETRPEYSAAVKALSRDLQSKDYNARFLALEPSATTEFPEDAREREIVEDLKRQWDKLMAAAPSPDEAGALDAAAVPIDPAGNLPEDTPISWAERWGKGKYEYYQTIYWKQSCLSCHDAFRGFDGMAVAERAALFEERVPFRVVKVVIPDAETQKAISWTWAMLLTTAIVTVSLSMGVLWLIIRYVIVKPLKHLRDVSDEISRGNTTLRAEIKTNDEFQELGDAFNRMLRHLVDAQQELRQVNGNLDAKVDQLAQANMQLYEMNRLRSDFLANMSHELRTPLNSIIGFSEVLQGIDALDEKQQRYVRNIQRSGRVLLDMINDILDLAKMESGKMEVRPTEFRIDTLLHTQCDVVRSLTDEKNIDLNVEIEQNLPILYQDQGKVQQILTNLLSNAIKFTPEGGRITVTAGRGGGGMLAVTVADTGVGIAEEDREIIFEKFRQGTAVLGSDNLTREYSGTGLGLSIVKELCKLLGGEVTFTSELGKGSAFTILLPWVCADQPRLDTSLAARLEDLTKPRRTDLLPAPTPEDDHTSATSATVSSTQR